jgi:hypothetical protein
MLALRALMVLVFIELSLQHQTKPQGDRPAEAGIAATDHPAASDAHAGK